VTVVLDAGALLALLVPGVEVRALDDALGRQAGVLLGKDASSDVIDAAVVLIAHSGDEIYTSDPDDLARLARSARLQIDVIPI